MKVVYVYADSKEEWNCSEWNCIIPTKAINRTKNHTATAIYMDEFIKNTAESQKACNEADIIVVERNFFADTLTMMQFWKVRNKTILAIFDDAYDILHPENTAYPFWTYGDVKVTTETGEQKMARMLPHPLDQFKWALKIAKGAQVVSENLAKDWAKYTPTYHVHNFLDKEKYTDVEPLHPHPKEEIYVGWCGGMSHYASFTESGVLEALDKLAKRNPNVTILISGDQRVFELLKTERKIYQPYVPYDKWASLLKSLDVGLAPLSGEYDKRRSWIKALEYMVLKIPWVATDYITYSELKDFGLLTKNGYQNWLHSLEEIVRNYPHFKELSETKGHEFALSQVSDNKIEKVTLALYQKLIDTPYTT